jgi:hypothetical protein
LAYVTTLGTKHRVTISGPVVPRRVLRRRAVEITKEYVEQQKRPAWTDAIPPGPEGQGFPASHD